VLASLEKCWHTLKELLERYLQAKKCVGIRFKDLLKSVGKLRNVKEHPNSKTVKDI